MDGRNFNDGEVKEQFQHLSSQLKNAAAVPPTESSKSTLSAILALLKEVLSVIYNPLVLFDILKLYLLHRNWTVVALKSHPPVLVRLSSTVSLVVGSIM